MKNNKIILLIFLACVVFGTLKVLILPFRYNTDFHTYIETSKLLSGDDTDEIFGFRILKPLEPAITAIMSPVFGHELSFYLLVIICFGLMGIAAYYLFRELSDHSSPITWISWTILMTSYPLVKYGLDSYTETGAWFLYILGLYLTYLFYKSPSIKLALINTLIFCLGFFWKEYAAINVLIFAILLIASNSSWKDKIKFATLSGGLFLVINGFYQLYVYKSSGYSYLDWLNTGAEGYASEFTIFYILKSLFALLLISWIFVPIGIYKLFNVSKSLKIYLVTGFTCSLAFLLWGYVSSRLYFVAVPILVFIVGYGIVKNIKSKKIQIIITTILVITQLITTYLMAR